MDTEAGVAVSSPARPLVVRALSVLACGWAMACGGSEAPAPPAAASSPEPWTGLMPRPASTVRRDGGFALGAGASISVPAADDGAAGVAALLAASLRPSTGFALPVISGATGTIRLERAEDAELGDEGYELSVDAAGIALRAASPEGWFHASQTLLQLLPSAALRTSPQQGPWVIGLGTIRDRPRFAWRGLMIDVARHFFTPAEVRRYVDVAARYKLNRLHLHLTDDQGWRLQIDAWPALTTKGGSTEVGGGPGGYYTKQEYAELVAYAAARFVTVVPEIDMPGHTRAALASVPELSCDGVAPPLYTGTQVGISSLCIGLPTTATFVRDVLGEVAAMTPGPYLHVGGDEAKKTSEADYAAFMTMVRAEVAARGKTLVGWEEIARSTPGNSVIAQHWLDEGLAAAAAAGGARVLLSPASRAYLDMRYDLTSPPSAGGLWAGFIDVRRAYDWDPGAVLDGVDERSIVGVEAPIWTETVATVEDMDSLVFPRLLGHAELAWSPRDGRDVDEYLVRLGRQGPRLDAMGVGYFAAPEVPWER